MTSFNADQNESIQSSLFISKGGMALIILPSRHMQLNSLLSTSLREDMGELGLGCTTVYPVVVRLSYLIKQKEG